MKAGTDSFMGGAAVMGNELGANLAGEAVALVGKAAPLAKAIGIGVKTGGIGVGASPLVRAAEAAREGPPCATANSAASVSSPSGATSSPTSSWMLRSGDAVLPENVPLDLRSANDLVEAGSLDAGVRADAPLILFDW